MYAQVPSSGALSVEKRRGLARRLYDLGALNFSGVQLKTGEITPVYFDIRLTMSDPILLQDLSRCMFEMLSADVGDFDLITGVPAAAVALATCMSIQTNIPGILTRKAAKDYGTKKVIEGVWRPGQNVLVVEDVVTYGDSIAETTGLLRGCGLRVKHAVVVVERQQGATQNLFENHGVKLHSLLTFEDILGILSVDGLIPMERVRIARDFIASAQYNRVKKHPEQKSKLPFLQLSSPLSDRIVEVVASALKGGDEGTCLLIDKALTAEELIELATQTMSGHIAALRIPPSLVSDAVSGVALRLRSLAKTTGTLLIADCKLTEGGVEELTEALSSAKAHFPPALWADVVTVYGPSASKGPLAALRNISKASRPLGALVCIPDDDSNEAKYADLAKEYSDVITGFVLQKGLNFASECNTTAGVAAGAPFLILLEGEEERCLRKTTNGHVDGAGDLPNGEDSSIYLMRCVRYSEERNGGGVVVERF